MYISSAVHDLALSHSLMGVGAQAAYVRRQNQQQAAAQAAAAASTPPPAEVRLAAGLAGALALAWVGCKWLARHHAVPAPPPPSVDPPAPATRRHMSGRKFGCGVLASVAIGLAAGGLQQRRAGRPA